MKGLRPRGQAADPPSGTASASTMAILRALRVALHVGFAGLLTVALLRLLFADSRPSAKFLLVGLAVLLAVVYLAGTVLEKRFASGALGADPRRYSLLWLGAVTVLWALLLVGSADFSWLAFPLFFLYLHLLPRLVALPAIAVLTAAVIAAQWAAGGFLVPQLPAVLGPLFGAGFSVVTGLAYQALYREAEVQRRDAEELRRTRAELAAAQHRAGVLAERGRIAQEIHDTLAQGLSSIVLVARAAEKSLAAGDPDTTASRLALVQQTASENLAEARNFVRGLSSPTLQESSLVDSLRRLCERTEADAVARGAALRCIFELQGDPVELPQPYRVALLRTAQASLGNTREHARADHAVVTLAFQGNDVTLDIYDDGVGFDPAAVQLTERPDGRGFGLQALRHRIGELNGSLGLESAPGEGTVVAVRLSIDVRLETGERAAQ
ncbi:sensor histidine kinase [Arthrobacter russicus]